jgi:hypothetical protein
MACSKIFSGGLPELLNEIMQYFHYDYKTLHSCILVNRLWCRLAIPLLWEDPFSIKVPKNYHFIEIYLHNINEDDKTKLYDYAEINNNIFPLNTLFNYPSFIQRLNTFAVCKSIEKWVATVGTSTIISQYSDHYLSPSKLTKLICRLLFLIFIENEVNLHSFEVRMNSQSEAEYLYEIYELILQNPNFICNIKNMEFDFNTTSELVTKFLKFFHSNCSSITSFYFLFASYVSDYTIIEKSLSRVINSQNNLKKILFGYNTFPLYYSLLSLKNPNCSNTLNTIIFYNVDFENMIILSEVFNQLNVLESIHMVYCYSLDFSFIRQINNITKPFKLKSLFLNEVSQIDPLKLLIQKSCDYLEYFEISCNESQQLLQSIIKYCSKIKYLGPVKMDNKSSIYLLLELIENITQNLNFLTIGAYYGTHLVPIILRKLGQILPFKLEYLNLNLTTNTSDLEIFLKNSQNTFIKKLLISNIKREGSQNIIPYIIEYIVKKKRVKYLAVVETFYGRKDDLFSLKDKVKECELYDIQVLNYDGSVIDVYDFMKEVY